MVLLIPRRIKQIKDEGRAEGFKIGFEEGFLEAYKETFPEGFRAGSENRKPQTRDEDIEVLKTLIAWYDSGDITAEEISAILSRRYRRSREAD